jgi:hypothetical protein
MPQKLNITFKNLKVINMESKYTLLMTIVLIDFFIELTRPEGFESLKIQCIKNSERLVNEACQDPSKRRRIVAQIFDDLSDELCRVADMAEFVRLAHPDIKMAKAAEGNEFCPMLK